LATAKSLRRLRGQIGDRGGEKWRGARKNGLVRQ